MTTSPAPRLSRRTLLAGGLATLAAGAVSGGTTLAVAAADSRVRAAGAGKAITGLHLGANHRFGAHNLGSTEWASPSGERLAAATRGLGLGASRFPGGTVANLYRWHTDEQGRPWYPKKQPGHGGPIPNSFDADEWGAFLKATDQQGVLVVNCVSQSPARAAAFVRHMVSHYPIAHIEIGNELGFGKQAYWMEGIDGAEATARAFVNGRQRRYTDAPVVPLESVGKAVVADQLGVLNILDEKRFPKGRVAELFVPWAPMGEAEVVVKANGTKWGSRVDDLASARPGERVYEIHRESGRITFGDGVRIPRPTGRVTVDYTRPALGLTHYLEAVRGATKQAGKPGIPASPGFNTYAPIRHRALVDALRSARVNVDGVVHHPYANIKRGRPSAEIHRTLQGEVAKRLREIDEMRRHGGQESVPLIVSEYGILVNGDGSDATLDRYVGGLGGALVTAALWCGLARAPHVPVLMKHVLVGKENIALVRQEGDALVRTPSALFFSMIRGLRGQKVVPAKVVHQEGVSVLVTGTEGRRASVLVVNPNGKGQVKVDFGAGFDPTKARRATVSHLTAPGDSLLASNTAAHPDAVKVVTSAHRGARNTVAVPAHSVTLLSLEW